MGIAPTIQYFGKLPTTIIMQSSSNFNGTAQTGTPELSPGLYTFPVQADGGLFDLHYEVIEIKQASYTGGGTCTVKKVSTAGEVTVATLTSGAAPTLLSLILSPDETVKFESSGGTNPTLTIVSALVTDAQ